MEPKLVAVSLEPARVALKPGDVPATIAVTIMNTSEITEHYAVSVVGLPEGATIGAPPVSKLNPGQTGTVELQIGLAAERPPNRGVHVLGVRVRSPYRPEVSRAEELTLVIAGVPSLSILAEPEAVTSRGHADYMVTLANSGNTELDVQMVGRDTEQQVRMVFTPPRVQIPAGGRARVLVRARARTRVSGPVLPRRITLIAHAGDLHPEVAVTMAQRPLIGGGVVRTTATLSGLAVVAAAIVVSTVLVGNKIIDSMKDRNSSSPSASPSPTPTSASPTTSVPATAPPPDTFNLSQPPGGASAETQKIGQNAYDKLTIRSGEDPQNRAECVDVGVSWVSTSGGVGYVAPGRPSDTPGSVPPLQCQDIPLRIALDTAGAEVDVTILGVGAEGVTGPLAYVFIPESADGNEPPQNVTVDAKNSKLFTISDSSGKGITAITIRPGDSEENVFVAAISLIVRYPVPDAALTSSLGRSAERDLR
jgi:hypothetical protein